MKHSLPSRLHSDVTLSAPDDVISHSSVTSGTGCGGNLTASSGGPVTSPNYPGYYGNNENCEWSITVPEGSIIRLTLTGDQPHLIPIISTSNTLFLRFRSDGSGSYQGFQFSYISSTAGQCWDPGVPTNGYRDNNSNFTSGQTVSYTCMDGYPLRGTANITCQPNGTWSGATPTCGEKVVRSTILGVNTCYKIARRRKHGRGPHGPNKGRVEVRPADSRTWGRVCDFNEQWLVYMTDLRCDGNESSLFDCSYAGWGNHDCRYGRYASVDCDPSRIRLIGGSGPNEGRVEVRPEDSMNWGTVCHNRFNTDDADVVCRMLGYPNATQLRVSDISGITVHVCVRVPDIFGIGLAWYPV
ncbi:hypothetical protein Bbelb_070980 [Branchiostoma belcheri]|nr:hypothetical protein Bbelb_070980 [Branchiostoma belcheri]